VANQHFKLPEENSYVCTKQIKQWEFNNNQTLYEDGATTLELSARGDICFQT